MSHHCHDEHDDHHHHHVGGAEHDHSDDITPAVQFSLYQQINFDEITTLNEQVHGSGKAILKKTWAERLETEPEVVSDADEQLIINVPYVASHQYHPFITHSIQTLTHPLPRSTTPSFHWKFTHKSMNFLYNTDTDKFTNKTVSQPK